MEKRHGQTGGMPGEGPEPGLGGPRQGGRSGDRKHQKERVVRVHHGERVLKLTDAGDVIQPATQSRLVRYGSRFTITMGRFRLRPTLHLR